MKSIDIFLCTLEINHELKCHSDLRGEHRTGASEAGDTDKFVTVIWGLTGLNILSGLLCRSCSEVSC